MKCLLYYAMMNTFKTIKEIYRLVTKKIKNFLFFIFYFLYKVYKIIFNFLRLPPLPLPLPLRLTLHPQQILHRLEPQHIDYPAKLVCEY